MRDYFNEEIYLIIEEMLSVLTKRLRLKSEATSLVGFGIRYSIVIGGGFYHQIKLSNPTDNGDNILPLCYSLFDKYYVENNPIRSVSISLGKLSKKEGTQLDIFTKPEKIASDNNLLKALDEIQAKYGKNSILKSTSLLSNSTIKERNKKIGGHHE